MAIGVRPYRVSFRTTTNSSSAIAPATKSRCREQYYRNKIERAYEQQPPARLRCDSIRGGPCETRETACARCTTWETTIQPRSRVGDTSASVYRIKLKGRSRHFTLSELGYFVRIAATLEIVTRRWSKILPTSSRCKCTLTRSKWLGACGRGATFGFDSLFRWWSS